MSSKKIPFVPQIQYTKTFPHPNGGNTVWYYDLEKSTKGPWKVEISYPSNYLFEDIEQEQENLPITKRKFFNEQNGKYVGYTRAIALGIINPKKS
jgi:hypothetical protein